MKMCEPAGSIRNLVGISASGINGSGAPTHQCESCALACLRGRDILKNVPVDPPLGNDPSDLKRGLVEVESFKAQNIRVMHLTPHRKYTG